MTLQATVGEHGDVLWGSHPAWRRACVALAGQRVTVTIEKWRDKRSKAQQGYYHGRLIEDLRQELGNTHEDMLDVIKEKFPSYFKRWREHTNPKGDVVEIPYLLSHNDLNTLEQEKLNEEILAWAATDLGIYIPPPEPSMGERGFRGYVLDRLGDPNA